MLLGRSHGPAGAALLNEASLVPRAPANKNKGIKIPENESKPKSFQISKCLYEILPLNS